MLNKARDDAGKQAQTSLRDTNNVVRMVTAGSKGSFINISQVRARQLSKCCFVCRRFCGTGLVQPRYTKGDEKASRQGAMPITPYVYWRSSNSMGLYSKAIRGRRIYDRASMWCVVLSAMSCRAQGCS